MYQLWFENEYGQRGIAASNNDIDVLVKTAKKEVSAENMENALTEDDKKKNWTSFFVEVFDRKGIPINNAFYSGRKNTDHKISLITKNGDLEEYNLSDKDVSIKCYIGEIRRDREGKDITIYHANTPKGQEITDITDQDLKQKTVYFIRKARD